MNSSIWLFLLCVGYTQAMTDLADSPGLLPFKMGEAKLLSHYSTVITLINIKEYNQLLTEWKIKYELFRKEHAEKSPFLIELFDKILRDVHTTLLGLRTGHETSERIFLKYEDAIEVLRTSIKTTKIANEHIAMSRESNDVFLQNLKNLKRQLKQLTWSDTSEVYKFLIDIQRALKHIETAIFQAKQGRVDNQVFSPMELVAFIDQWQLNAGELLLPLIKENVHDKFYIYDLLQVRTMAKDDEIAFITSIPIMDPKIYALYRLYAQPVRNEQVLQAIIPQKMFYLYNKDLHIMTDQNCQKIKDVYYCKENSNIVVKNDYRECLMSIINGQNFFGKCQYTSVYLEDAVYVEPVDAFNYIIVSSEPFEIITSNGTKTFLFGTYLVELDEGESFSIGGKVYANDNFNKDFDRFQPILTIKSKFVKLGKPSNGDPIKITSLSVTQSQLQHTKVTQSSLNLEIIVLIILVIQIVIFLLISVGFCCSRKAQSSDKQKLIF